MQLETQLVAHGVAIPQMLSRDDQSMLQELMAAYLPVSENNGTMSATGEIAATQSLASPAGSVLPTESRCRNVDMQGHVAVDHFQSYEMSAVPAMLDSNSLLDAPQSTLEDVSCFDPMIDADWIWNVSTFPSLAMSEDINFSMQNFPSTIDMLPDIATASGQMQTPHSLDDENSTDDEGSPEVTNQFSDRFGTLLTMREGQTRFYGATSNFHILHNLQRSGVASSSNISQQSTDDLLQSRGIGHKIDVHLLTHLVNLYFAWHNSAVQMVDKQSFDIAQQKMLQDRKTSDYYSEFLLNAM
jgi:hypothetical protein